MYRRSRRLLVALASLVAVGCNGGRGPGTTEPEPSGSTIEIEMVDNAFHPAEITVAKGQSVTLRFTNKGAVAHEAFVGDGEMQADHEARMSSGAPEGKSQHGHDHGVMQDEPSSVTLQPGQSGTIMHVFDQDGSIEIACHEPGHYAAGMKIAVSVA